MTNNCEGQRRTNLNQAISNQSHQQFVASALSDKRGVLGPLHAREVKDGHVRLAGVVLSKLQLGQSPPGGEVGGVAGVATERLLIDVGGRQQILRFVEVLDNRMTSWRTLAISCVCAAS